MDGPYIEVLARSIDAMERKNRQGQRQQQASRAPGVGPYDRLGGCGSTLIPARINHALRVSYV